MRSAELLGRDLGNDIRVIGEGSIGEKASQLVDKTPLLRGLGFHTPPRKILAEGLFDDFFQRNNLGENLRSVGDTLNVVHIVRNGHMSLGQFQTLATIGESLDSRALVVRSSGEGDARGTGIYVSEFAENNPGRIRKAVQAVLAGYFSESALAFRRDAKTGEGFGIIIEPLVGQDYGSVTAPVVSGFGYTSTSRGEGYINVVPGIGGGVETRDGEIIKREDLAQYGSLQDYITGNSALMGAGFILQRRSALLGTSSDLGRFRSEGKVFICSNRHMPARLITESFDFDNPIRQGFRSIDLKQLFQMMDGLEQALGKAQYLEWAALVDPDPKYWILQIADVDKKLDILDFADFGRILYQGRSVAGSGTRDCSKIVFCDMGYQLSDLEEFNRNNRDYVLFYSGNLTTKGPASLGNMEYKHCSNAAVLIEEIIGLHMQSPLAHLQGLMDMTGKLFALFEPFGVSPETARHSRDEIIERYGAKEGELMVLNGRFKVVASERQERLVIYAQE